MKRRISAAAVVLLSLAATLLAFALLDDPGTRSIASLPKAADIPVAAHIDVALDLPLELRTKNWGGGSCVHASTVNLLKWMGLMDLANWWRNTYSGGEYDTRLVKRMEDAGLRYAFIHGGVDRNNNGKDDGEEFIEWTVRTRRGCGIFYKPMHAINLVHLDDQYAYLLDNNYTDYPERHGTYERVPRAEFFRQWRGYGGFAWTLVYDPTPPRPYIVEAHANGHAKHTLKQSWSLAVGLVASLWLGGNDHIAWDWPSLAAAGTHATAEGTQVAAT